MTTPLRPMPIAALSLLIGIAAACSSGPSGGTAGSQPAATSQPTSAASVPATAGPAATPAAAGQPAVDLVFTGPVALTAKGTAGRCGLARDASGNVVSFGFEAGDKDYPGLGLSFSMAQFANADYVDIKWVIDATTFFARPVTGTVAITPDHHGVTIDTDLNGSRPGEHLKGTITCP